MGNYNYKTALQSRCLIIDYQKSIKYFWQICEGLKSAHAEHCWHRDLKPENILYDEEEDIVVVADFGIAHFSDDDKVDKIETKNTEKLANFKYHSPEQVPGKVVEDATADIWALGYILNEMFTNEIPLGENYKKISSVTRIYKNLDLLVSEMIKSDKKERCSGLRRADLPGTAPHRPVPISHNPLPPAASYAPPAGSCAVSSPGLSYQKSPVCCRNVYTESCP